MKKRKGSLTTATETIAGEETPEAHRMRTGDSASKGEIVGITLRLSREAWRDLHEMALKENVSLNTLILMGMNEYRQSRALPTLKPTPSISKS